MRADKRYGAAVLAVATLGVSAAAWAGNAAWYRWESRIDGHVVCAQSSPGSGWQRIAGPYEDAGCRRPR